MIKAVQAAMLYVLWSSMSSCLQGPIHSCTEVAPDLWACRGVFRWLPKCFETYDFNRDSHVDMRDVAIMQRLF